MKTDMIHKKILKTDEDQGINDNYENISVSQSNNSQLSISNLTDRSADFLKKEYLKRYIGKHLKKTIPCLFFKPELNTSDKLIIFFHANAEDLSSCYEFVYSQSEDLDVFIFV